jgi:hypothetical protein
MVELRGCEICGSMFPIYNDKSQKYCAKHRKGSFINAKE